MWNVWKYFLSSTSLPNFLTFRTVSQARGHKPNGIPNWFQILHNFHRFCVDSHLYSETSLTVPLTLSPPEYFDMLNHQGRGGWFSPLVKDGLWSALRPVQRPPNRQILFLTSSSICRTFELCSMLHSLTVRGRRSSLLWSWKFTMWKS